jgi:chaperone BCS1
MQSILDDAREFLDSEEWYTLAGIPYRRGYLLHGPPGTGKSAHFVSLLSQVLKYILCRFDNIWYCEL